MADKTDPRVQAMVRAWIEYATNKKIATPERDGRPPEDTDVLTFLQAYLPPLMGGVRLSKRGLKSIQGMLGTADAGQSNKNTAMLNRIKLIIDDKLTKPQINQLKRELERG